jgi:hypothetical protein
MYDQGPIDHCDICGQDVHYIAEHRAMWHGGARDRIHLEAMAEVDAMLPGTPPIYCRAWDWKAAPPLPAADVDLFPKYRRD